MKSVKSLDAVYGGCCKDGLIREKDAIDYELIRSLLHSAEQELAASKEIEKTVTCPFVLFKLYYDVLRKLISAFLLFDRIKSENHQCLNAYLCVKHPNLDIDWETIETFRGLRNSISYEGKDLGRDVWLEMRPKLEIYIMTFSKRTRLLLDICKISSEGRARLEKRGIEESDIPDIVERSQARKDL